MESGVWDVVKYIVAINCCELLVGFVGNVISCLVILCSRSMHTITEFYLLSLSVSDLMILTTGILYDVYTAYHPGENFFTRHNAANLIREWIFETSVNASILTVTAFTVERYLAICHPFFVQSLDKMSRFKKVISIIWLTAAVLAVIPVTESHFSLDSNDAPLPRAFVTAWPYMLYTTVIVCFVLPMLLIVVMYVLIGIKLNETSIERQTASQAERERTSTKALKMFAVIILLFFISWAPYYVEEIMWYYKYTRGGATMFNMVVLKLLTYTLSSALNPIIYVMMSRKFRQSFKELITKWTSICSKKRTNTVPLVIA